MKAADFFTLPPSLAAFVSHFPAEDAPWAWIKAIAAALTAQPLAEVTSRSAVPSGVYIEGKVYLHPTVKFPPHATIIGPTWIGAQTEIRPGAFIRGNVIVGEKCVLGNSCEFKNCLLMDNVQVPHFSYVGDSILGSGAHLGAGVILSNLRLDQKPITIHLPDQDVDTGLRKFGAILGENAEVGCNAVLQPGTLLGRRALVMSTLAFGGYLPPNMIARVRETVTTFPRRD